MQSNQYRGQRRHGTDNAPDHNEPGIERPAHLAPHGPSPPFNRLTALFEWCSKKKLELRRRYLATWFDNWRKLVGPDLYPVMRLLLPQKDRERATYGFKEAALAKAFISSFGLNEKSKDAQSLINWKKPGEEGKATGDFATVLYQTIGSRSSVSEGTLTIDELNSLLDSLSKSFRVSAKLPERKNLIEHVFKTLTEKCAAAELKWICRIILKDLNIGMKENTVFSVFHSDAMDLYNSCSDLQKICYDLADPEHRLEENEKLIKLFKSFQPMLCGRSNTTQEAVKLMLADKNDNGFIMEEKLDGERIQLHKRGNEFYFCSRKGKDYTYLYGSNISNGSLVPYIRNAFHPQLTDLILDGEMMVWDPEIEKYLPFGNLKTSALDKNPAPGKPHPCFKIFDVLYIRAGNAAGPKILTNNTLSVRLGVLKNDMVGSNGEHFKLFREVPGRLEFALQKPGFNAQDVEQFLTEVVEERGEGLVLKKHKSPYILADRDNRKWVKVKPEYMDDMGETVDVLVAAASWGSGSRGGRVSSLICFVQANHIQGMNGRTMYQTFVRIGSGLNFGDYEWVNAKPWKRVDKEKLPPWFLASPAGSEDKGDVYLEPEDAFMISVKAASLNVTDQYACGWTMRFPRCKEIRRDLGTDDCLKYTDLLTLTSGKRRAEEQPSQAEPVKKRKTTRKEVAVSGAHRGADVDGLEMQSSLFSEMKFYVIPYATKGGGLTKQEIEKMWIHEHGGTYHQTAKVSDASIIYGGTVDSPPVAAIMKKGEKDIIKSDWVVECVRRGEVVPLSRRYLYFATESRKRDPEFYGSPTLTDEEQVDDDTEQESEAGGEPAVDPETRSWIMPDRDESPDSTKHKLKVNEPESDTESEEFDPDEDPYDFGVISGSDKAVSPEAGLERDIPSPEPASTLKSLTKSPKMVGEEEFGIDSLSVHQEDIQMGDDHHANEYDTELIFKHLMFYLDSPSNARSNGMEVTTSTLIQDLSTKEMAKIEQLIVENGGKVTNNPDEPKLTHVVLFKRDISRRVALMRRTAMPKRRHLVLTNFVSGCIGEETLLDEDAFVP